MQNVEKHRKQIQAALKRNAYNMTATATDLKISRQTLYNRIRNCGITMTIHVKFGPQVRRSEAA